MILCYQLLYMYLGFLLMGLFVIMIIPANNDVSDGKIHHYGMGVITLYNAAGDEMFSQSIHNQLYDAGETFLLEQTFEDGTSITADTASIGSICISADTSVVLDDTKTAAGFDATDNLTEANCKEDADSVVAISNGVATVSPTTFTCGGTNCTNDDTITTFAVCQMGQGTSINCAPSGIIFAEINITDVTLAASETLQVTYIFDISNNSQ